MNSSKDALVEYDDFDKVELKVAEIIAVEEVPKSDKLLQFRLNAGDSQDRQILSGIKKWYPNYSELVGKKVVIVANMKPRKMMGRLSQGMILSAEYDGEVQLTILPDSVVPGSGVE